MWEQNSMIGVSIIGIANSEPYTKIVSLLVTYIWNNSYSEFYSTKNRLCSNIGANLIPLEKTI